MNKSLHEVKEQARKLAGLPIGSLDDVIKRVEAHYDCQATVRDLDKTYVKMAMLGSELSEKAARWVFQHASECGLKIQQAANGAELINIKRDGICRYIVVRSQAKDGSAYLWVNATKTRFLT